MCIIMMFNQNKSIKYRDIKLAMKFDDDTASKNLKSLMLQKFKLIECITTVQGNFSEDDEFIINEKFSSQLKRVVFPTPILEEVYKKGNFIMVFNINRNRPRRQINCH